MYRVYLALGSNIGDRLQYLIDALEAIDKVGHTVATSSVYETEPVEMNSDYSFYNMAASIDTELTPPDLLQQLKKIEENLGRKPLTHLKDREIDIDILLYENKADGERMQYKDSMIEIPHPLMQQRQFVLEPLREIAPEVIHPTSGKTIDMLWRGCRTGQIVTRMDFHLTH